MGRKTIKLVLTGHLDHGKSTLIGRLLLDTHSLSRQQLLEIQRISKEFGKTTELAYLIDQLKEEREKSLTIDTTQAFFKTRKKNYIIIDAPGHTEFIKKMLTGASQANAAILIIDVCDGIQEQTKRHAFLIAMLGIKSVIVAFNKMDLVDYRKERYEEVKTALLECIKPLPMKPSFFVPIAAKQGVNISRKSSYLSWYKGSPLLKILDSLHIRSQHTDNVLRFPVQDIYELEGKNIIVGKVVSGTASQGQPIQILPTLHRGYIQSILMFNKPHTYVAGVGENIGLLLRKPLPIKRGDVITQRTLYRGGVQRFGGTLFWMAEEPLTINKTVTVQCTTQEESVVVEHIAQRTNSSTLEIIEKNADKLQRNEAAQVTFRTKRPMVIEKFNDIEELGRFVVREKCNLQGAGIVTWVNDI